MNETKLYSVIKGGLGNQMFQYAAGLSLAKNRDARLILDASFFTPNDKRGFALSSFDKKLEAVTTNIGSKNKKSFKQRMKKILYKIAGKKAPSLQSYKHGLPVVEEPHFHFWDDFHALDVNCCIEGYWQSELYFKGVEDEIRTLFDLSKFQSTRTAASVDAIAKSKNAIAVHIRRGDYVDPKILAHHGICEDSYYKRAKTIIEGITENPQYFVFSDNIDAAKEICKDWPNTTFISGNSQEQDMMLMSMCDHNIIANSSFSWWAAWLNKNPEKTVIAPRRWFSKRTLRTLNVTDLLPDDYITI